MPLDGDALETFRRHTGRTTAPTEPFNEAWVIVGRRGGKSRIAALVAVFLAVFRDYTDVLADGERAVVMVLAADRKQARVVFGYVLGFLGAVPALAQRIEAERRESVDLAGRVGIEIHTASLRTARGYTLCGVVCDESAFWRSDTSANPDTEVLQALRPGMATVPGAVLLGISTAYARRGELWNAYRMHYGQEGAPVLVWQSDTASMNPAIDPTVIARAYEADPIAAAAEYGGEFRKDIQALFDPGAVEAVTMLDRRELPPVRGVSYVAFVDPSGGSANSMTLAIAHRDRDTVVLDCVRERRPPFSPDAVCKEFAGVLQSYGVRTVTGDRYGGEWPRERFQVCGITFQTAEHTKSELYLESLAIVNAGRCELLDLSKLRAQLERLERRTSRGSGKETVDHAPGAHDDVANAVCGALVVVGTAQRSRARVQVARI